MFSDLLANIDLTAVFSATALAVIVILILALFLAIQSANEWYDDAKTYKQQRDAAVQQLREERLHMANRTALKKMSSITDK